MPNRTAVLAKLHTTAHGLTTAEAKHRLERYGPNHLPTAKQAGWWPVLLAQGRSPLVYILLTAAAISLVLDERVDAAVITMAVAIQVAVGFIQEYKAQTALAALQKVMALSARVKRDGKEQVLPADELVPGDIILVQAGEKIPADGRLLDSTALAVTEAALTGESDAVTKDAAAELAADTPVADQSNMIFAGTVVVKGGAEAVITATGWQTAMGQIARLIQDTADAPTPLQNQLAQFARKVSVMVVLIAAGIFIFGYLHGDNIVEIFTVAVAVAVSAIPEGLAIAVTIILAVGMQRILRRQGLVRTLVAAETLGSTEVICTDKTGTLTEGKMQVTDIVTWDNNFAFAGQRRDGEEAAQELVFALRIGLLCNDAKVTNPDDMITDWVMSGNLTERALLLAASQTGLHYTTVVKTAPRLDAIPFDSDIKYMATLHREAQGHMLYIKGAPEIILQHCTQVVSAGKAVHFTDEKQKQFEHKFIALSKKGLRIIALAYKYVGSARQIAEAGLDELVCVGYIGIKDPLRPEAKRTIAECNKAGIATVMITGDHKFTARAIAEELGIPLRGPEAIIEGHELNVLNQHELNRRVPEITVYARVTPQHKLRIVQAWQSHGKVVAMTGDGINDAPAMKAAAIGVALGSGTDVAKETADMVILDDNFGTIVAAVEEGRGIFDNIRKTVLYLLSDSFTEVILIITTLVAGLPVPVTAAMILWVNIITDSFPSLAMTQEPKEPENMLEPPRGRKAAILDKEMYTLIGVISALTGACCVAIFSVIYRGSGDVTLARTVVFLFLGLDSLAFMFTMRSLRRLLWQIPLWSNRWMWAALVAGVVLQAVPIYVPWLQPYFGTMALSWIYWVMVVGLVLGNVVVIECIKYIFLLRGRRRISRPRP